MENKSWLFPQLFLSAFCWKSGEMEKATSFSQKCLIFTSAFRKSWQEKKLQLFPFSPQLFILAFPERKS